MRHDLLTPSERRVVGMIATGMTNREIADELGLAESTVKNRVSDVLQVTGMTNRTELAVWHLRRGFTVSRGTRTP
jgi:two-component system response regulator DevR